MPYAQVTPEIAVAPQLSPDDIAQLATDGFRTVICHRPDGEGGPDQPSFQSIAAACAASGIYVHHQPVSSSGLSPDDVTHLRDILLGCAKPALLYCRSGTRSIVLWALSQRGAVDNATLLAACSDAGYDLPVLHHLLAD
ncbi:MAG: TIGR01244 family sulfur transferase [Pseudomonadota bacterium]